MKVKLLFIAAMLCAAMTATTATANSTAAAANNAKISGRIKDANEKSAIIGATVLLMLNFNVNPDFGTKHREGWQRLNNEDAETGILSETK